MLNFIPFVRDLSVILHSQDIITFNIRGGIHYRVVFGDELVQVNESDDEDVLYQTVVSAMSGMMVSPRYSESVDHAVDATRHRNLPDIEVIDIELVVIVHYVLWE